MPAEIFADGDQDYIEKFNTVAQQAFDGDAAAGRLDDHIDGTADKHGASAIVNTPAGGIAATDVQAAINELDTEKQPIDATLTALAGVTTAADKLIYATGADTFATTDLTSAGRALMDDADASVQRTTLGLGTAATLASDTDTTLAANSDTRLATQKAVKAYVDALIAASDAVVFKGVTDCSANPNYPAADAGHLYIVSVAGKIGGASGVTVEAGDMFICKVDSTASGDQATVGANWSVIQTNINGAVVGPSSAGDSRVVMFDGTTGKLIKDSGLTLSGTNTGDQTSVTGNAGSATILQTARNINGVGFNGSADITVTAAAGTLTGATLAAGVTASSLTSVGTLTSLTTSGQITSSLSTGTAPFSVASTTNVANLNASSLSGATFAAPGTIGGGTPGAATFTTLTATGQVSLGGAAGGEGLRVQSYASLVNRWGMYGNFTGEAPRLFAEGSDSSISTAYSSKGGGSHFFLSDLFAAIQFVVARTASAVNYPKVAGSATGAAVPFSVGGSDAHIDLSLVPKGANGRVMFGTHAAIGAETVTGYIEIKDSGGTVRKLAVVS